MSNNSSETKCFSGIKGHIPALDGLRGLAVAAVFALHYHPNEQLGPSVLRVMDCAALLGWAGVSLFFALSGFLITGILWDSLGRAHWWRNFYIRRSLRIFPLYYMVLVAVTAVALAMGSSWKSTAKIGIDVLYLSDIPWLWREMFGFPLQSALVHFWSLAVEEQFYLIWPFLLLASARNRKSAMNFCLVIWILSFTFRLIAVGSGWSWLWPHHFLLSRAGELCAGSFLALALRGAPESFTRILRVARWAFWGSSLILVFLVVTRPTLSLMDPLWSTLGIAVFSILFSTLIAQCLEPGAIRSFFENAVLRWLGKISYGIYVYHLLLYGVFQWLCVRIAPHAGPLEADVLLATVGVCGTLLVATFSFYTFECAFLSLKEKLASQQDNTAKARKAPEPIQSESC